MIGTLIPPTRELEHFGSGSMHLLLAHLFEDPFYVAHYQEQQREGAHIILDNSAYELGQSQGHGLRPLVSLALIVNADEIILPDAMEDSRTTAMLVGAAMQEMATMVMDTGTIPFRPFYVAQGENEKTYRECLRFIVNTHQLLFGDLPFTLGISRVYRRFEGGRERLLERYYSQLHEELGDGVAFHLLGWNEDVPAIARSFPWVRSVDSAEPFNWAFAGKDLHKLAEGEEAPARPDDYFDLTFTDEQREQAQRNCVRYLFACEGNSLPVLADNRTWVEPGEALA